MTMSGKHPTIPVAQRCHIDTVRSWSWNAMPRTPERQSVSWADKPRAIRTHFWMYHHYIVMMTWFRACQWLVCLFPHCHVNDHPRFLWVLSCRISASFDRIHAKNLIRHILFSQIDIKERRTHRFHSLAFSLPPLRSRCRESIFVTENHLPLSISPCHLIDVWSPVAGRISASISSKASHFLTNFISISCSCFRLRYQSLHETYRHDLWPMSCARDRWGWLNDLWLK